MSKFYLQSGSVKVVVTAADEQGAALWLLNKTIEQHLPIDQIETRQIGNGMVEALLLELADFASEVTVSQRGFGNDDIARFSTDELIRVWSSLLLAIDRIIEQPHENGLQEG